MQPSTKIRPFRKICSICKRDHVTINNNTYDTKTPICCYCKYEMGYPKFRKLVLEKIDD